MSVHTCTAPSQSPTCVEDARPLLHAEHDLKQGLTKGTKRDGSWWPTLQLEGLLTSFANHPLT